MPRALFSILIPLLAACGGGSGGGDPDPPPPPPDPITTARSTGLPVDNSFGDLARVGDIVLVPVSEMQAGVDLNGDLDVADRVITRLDTRTDATQNLSLACAGRVIASNQRFAFTVSEPAQGLDLNGDGDQLDNVWHVHHVASQITQNLAIAAPAVGNSVGTAGGFVLLRSEAGDGFDLNFDGDMLDTIAVPFDDISGALAPAIPGPVATNRPLIARNGRVLIARSEPSAGLDLNADGDQLDNVLSMVDFQPGLPTFVDFARSVATLPYALTDSAAVYLIDEATSGADLNLDADQTDAILAVFNVSSGLGEQTPFSGAASGFAVAAFSQAGLAVGRDHVIVAITEGGHFNQDLNTDGDPFDAVLAWVDTTTAPGTLNIVPIAVGGVPSVIDGARGLFAVSEANEGIFDGTDLNQDGDDDDQVLHRLDTTTGAITNLGLAVASMTLRDDDAIVSVIEASNGTGPLNEDGDTDDSVLRYVRLDTLSSRNLAIVSTDFAFVRPALNDLRLAVILNEGQSVPFGDLNQDGDTDDRVLVLIQVNSDGGVPVVVAPTPEVSDTAAADLLPPLEITPDVFLIPTSEAAAGQDRNGDADLGDTVLTEITITPPA